MLKTTGNAIKSSGIDEIGKTINSVNHQVQREIRKAFKTTSGHGEPRAPGPLHQRAHGNVQRIERCTRRF